MILLIRPHSAKQQELWQAKQPVREADRLLQKHNWLLAFRAARLDRIPGLRRLRQFIITNTNLIALLPNDMIAGGENPDSMIITHINLMETTASNAIKLSHGFISGKRIVKKH
ncbi:MULTISPECIES: hypothetical protein [unclassified Paenibacillus]|uniref:hypothetical protein n=1 Tax=unclassified Paenibacillus TaxID=185978 RepID=UPI002404A2FC|nr:MULTISPECIES: hypothetical protein [unclassified Paenibacillus]